jgi:signal transduction histidine kinase
MAIKTTLQVLLFLGALLGFSLQLEAQNTVVISTIFEGENIALSNEFLIPDSTTQTTTRTYEFNLVNITQSSQNISFVVEDPTVSFITISKLLNDEWVEIGRGGSSIPKQNRSYSGLSFTCQTEIGIGYYPDNFRLTISTKPNLKKPNLWVSTTRHVAHKTARNTFVLGIFFGLLLIVFVYTLFSFFSLKQAYFIWFSFFILALGVNATIRTGVFSYVLNSINEVALLEISSIVITLIFIAFTRFLQLLLNTQKQYPNINRLLILIVAVRIVLNLFAFVFPDYSWENILVFSRIELLFTILIGIYITLKNNRTQRWFLTAILSAFGFLLFAGMIDGFLDLGILHANFITLGFWLGAGLIQLLMFLWVISIHVNQIANEHILLGEKMRDTKKALVNAYLTGINKEKQHISKQLNVVVLEEMKTITDNLKLENGLDQNLWKDLNTIKTDIQHISDELKVSSSNSFTNQVQQLISQHNSAQTDFQFRSFNYNDDISILVQQNLFRVIQEAIHNIEKYANASVVIIEINQDYDQLNLTITDNGVGFNSTSSTKGIGIENMRLRINKLNGTFQLKTSIGEGVSIQITVPLTDD